jgi:hypothetical protein
MSWRTLGRLLCAFGAGSIALIPLARGERASAGGEWSLVLLGAFAALYGAGAKLADLTTEHGLRSRPFQPIAHGMSALGLVALAPFSAGATLIASELVFHGVIKGKADNRPHVIGAAFVVGALVAAFALLLMGTVDWPTVAIVVAGSVAWMWANNRWLRLGDHLFHQLRGDMIVTFGVLALVDAQRWLPFAVVVTAEHLAYALTKRIAMRFDWYQSGNGLVERDSLAIAFHEQGHS